jgi:sulfur-carrier protein
MKIEIHLFASLSAYLPPGSVDKTYFMEIKDNSVIKDMIEQAGIPRDAVKLIFLNGKHASDAEVLRHGDRLGIFPPIGGG